MSRARASRPAAGRRDPDPGHDAVWVAVTFVHLMLGYQYSRETGRRLQFADVGHCDLGCWSRALAMPVPRFSLRSLVRPLAAGMARLLRGQKMQPILYLPHLSGMIFRRRHLWLLRLLQRLSLIEYFDDGMSSVSTAGVLWRDRLIPVPPDRLITWDYTFLPRASGTRRVSVRENHADLAARFRPDHDPESAGLPPSPRTGATPERLLVIASKCLDWDALCTTSLATTPLHDVVYVPHYREHKNNDFLQRHACVWKPHPNLEIALPGRIGAFSRCYFGVTSTVFYVLEALRAAGMTVDTVFVPTIDVERCAFPAEARDFLDRLGAYADEFRFILPG